MNAVTLRENPVPVLLVLLSLFGFVEYLHWSAVSREGRTQVVQVPATLPPQSGADDEETASTIAWAVAQPGSSAVAGPLHAQAGRLMDAGRTEEALARLDASLRSEGTRDAQRLGERGVLLLRLDRPGEALGSLTEAQRLGASSSAFFYNLGLARARAGDPNAAEQEYRRALDLNPGFDEAWRNLGLLLEDRGERAAAIDALKRAIATASASGRHRSMIDLARLLDQDGKRDKARDLLEEAIQSAPGDPAPYAALGLIEARHGDADSAQRHYEKALDLRPGYRRARYNMALLLLDQGKPAEAARQLEILTQEHPEPKVWFSLGRARRALKDDAGAQAAYREAIRLAEGKYPEAFYNLGILLHDGKQDKEAEAAYVEAVTQDPGLISAWINLALLREDNKRPAEALDASTRAVASGPENEKAWYVHGRLLAAAGRRDEALAAFLKAAALQHGNTKALMKAAVLQADLGHDVEAIALYRQVLASDPRNAVAWYNMGLALHRAGRDEDARAAYEEALRADPEATSAAQNLGVLYARAGRVEDARRVFAEALEREPEDVGLRYNLALQLQKLNRNDEALRELRRVVQLDENHQRAWSALARLLEAAGQSEEAARARARAAALGEKKASPRGDAP